MGITSDSAYLIIEAEVGRAADPGAIGAGARRFIPITGGRISGAIQGEIIPGGADWQTVHDDGNLQIDAHYAFRAVTGGVVEVISSGVRAGAPAVLRRLGGGETVNPAEYYFRTALRFRTGASELAFLNFRLYIGRGERLYDRVRLEVFEVL
jgi:Protein of unknown function (DUF3237)